MKKMYTYCLMIWLATPAFSQYYPPSIQWQKTIGTFDIDQFNAVIPTADGGYIAAGKTHGNDLDISDNHGGVDALIVKYDAAGVMQWQKCYGGTLDDGANAILQTNDGGFVIAGQAASNDGDLTFNRGFNDAWIFKISPLGTIQWQKNYGSSTNDMALSIRATADGGYIFCGQTTNNDGDAAGGGFKGLADVWIVKLTLSGTMEWQRCYGSSRGEAGYDVRQTSDGGYVFCGYASGNDGDVTGVHTSGPNPNRRDMWIGKINSTGMLAWQKSLGGQNAVSPSGFADDEAYAILQTADGGFIVTGICGSIDGDVTNYHGGIRDGWIIKLSSTGSLLWQKTIGGSSDDYVRNIIKHPDGGFVLCGYTASGNGDLAGQPLRANIDAWLIKIDSLGNIQWQRMLRTSGIDGAISIAITPGDGLIVGGWASFNDLDAAGNPWWGTNPNAWIVKLSPQVLPVTLLGFTITKSNDVNVLKWETVNEVNFRHFTIERSDNGNFFSTIASVPANNVGALNKMYSYTDRELLPVSKLYYRLKLTDNDGSYTYSTILTMTPGKQEMITVFPNPANSLLTIQSETLVKKAIITDLAGRVYLTKKGSDVKTLDISSLPTGVYYLQTFTSNNTANQMPFIKK